MALRLIILSYLSAFSCAYSPYIGQGEPLGDFFKFNRVIGGKNAAKGEFPHQVSLQYGYPPYMPFSHQCGGSILNEGWILTAAHCVNNLPKYGELVVKAGKKYIKTRESTEQVALIARIFIHNKYRGSVSPYDIALIKLLTPLKFNKFVNYINLPQANALPQGKAVLSGWGSISKTLDPVLPNSLQKVTLPIIDLNTCIYAFKMLGEPWEVHETNVCTGPLTGGFSACNGDSGGPLIGKNQDGTTDLIGVVSWGMVPCGGVGAPAVFVRVSAFVEWINTVMSTYYD